MPSRDGAGGDTHHLLDRLVVRWALWRGDVAGLGAVVPRLGALVGGTGALRVSGAIASARLRGEPFGELPRPPDRQDRLSRRQARDLILLYRALRGETSAAAALELCREVVIAAAVPFMATLVPARRSAALRSMVPQLVRRFFNVEARLVVDDSGEGFDVVRCRFVELLHAIGCPELAPLFCAADVAFFDGLRRPVVLRRSDTLAAGASRCDFRFVPTE